MAMIGKVLRMHHRDKRSVREIVRATSLVRKYQRKAASTKLMPFVEMVKMALLAAARRSKKERRTAKALLKRIADAGYQGGYTQLTEFIRAWRASQGGVAPGKAFVPLAFEMGEAFQFDWSFAGLGSFATQCLLGLSNTLQIACVVDRLDLAGEPFTVDHAVAGGFVEQEPGHVGARVVAGRVGYCLGECDETEIQVGIDDAFRAFGQHFVHQLAIGGVNRRETAAFEQQLAFRRIIAA